MNQTTRLARLSTYLLPVLLVAVLAGFWPSYFMALSDNRLSLHVHGMLMLSWVTMLILQSTLARMGRYSWHRRIGKLSYALAPLILLVGLWITSEFIHRAGEDPSEFQLQIFTISFVSILGFSAVYLLAMLYRSEPALHARFMIGTVLMLVGAAILRILMNWGPAFPSFAALNHTALLFAELITVGLIVNDYRMDRIRAPFLIVLGLLLCVRLMFWLAPEWNWWDNLAVWMGALTT